MREARLLLSLPQPPRLLWSAYALSLLLACGVNYQYICPAVLPPEISMTCHDSPVNSGINTCPGKRQEFTGGIYWFFRSCVHAARRGSSTPARQPRTGSKRPRNAAVQRRDDIAVPRSPRPPLVRWWLRVPRAGGLLRVVSPAPLSGDPSSQAVTGGHKGLN